MALREEVVVILQTITNKTMHNKTLQAVSFFLMAVGGLNWLLVGAFDFNLVTALLGSGTITTVVYILVGLGTIISIITRTKR